MVLLTVIRLQPQVRMSSYCSSSDDSHVSEYFPTPIRHTMAVQTPLVTLPNKCSLTQIQQLDSFIQKTNRGCERKGCQGKIVPVEVITENTGRAVDRCRKCSTYSLFESCGNPITGSFQQRNILMATQVVFISAGCTHAKYKKVIDILEISAVSLETLNFMSTDMVTEMCNREKKRMKGQNSAHCIRP